MRVLTLALLLVTGSAAGAESFTASSRSVYRVGSAALELLELTDRNASVSPQCTPSPPAHAVAPCDALRALDRASLEMLPGHRLAGGPNPGAILCRAAGGTLLKGFTKAGDEVALCRFADGSVTTSGSLLAGALRHGK